MPKYIYAYVYVYISTCVEDFIINIEIDIRYICVEDVQDWWEESKYVGDYM